MPVHLRGVSDGGAEIQGVRVSDYTVCVAAGGHFADPSKAAVTCQPVAVTASQTVAIVVQ